MRSLRRPALVPPSLRPPEGVGYLRFLAHQQQHAEGGPEPTPVGGWDELDVIGVLLAMQGEICAYCGREFREVADMKVEHFRPRSLYWFLAWQFDNLFLACTACQQRKGDEFPVGNTRASYATRDHCDDEAAHYPRPDIDPIEDMIELGEPGRLVGRGARARAFDSLADRLGLNQGHLRRERIRHKIEVEKALAELADSNDIASGREITRKACRCSPHSIVTVRLLEQYSLHNLMPDEAAELRWLLKSLTEYLDVAPTAHASTHDERGRRICHRAIAALWLIGDDQQRRAVDDALIDKQYEMAVRNAIRELKVTAPADLAASLASRPSGQGPAPALAAPAAPALPANEPSGHPPGGPSSTTGSSAPACPGARTWRSTMDHAANAFDVVILCALARPELQKVLNTGDAGWRNLPALDNDPSTYHETTYTTARGNSLRVVATAANQMGMPSSAVLATKMILRFRPRLVAMVGIAAGAKRGSQGYGDVLVPDQTFDYGAGKLTLRGGKVHLEPAPEPLRISELMRSRLNDWSGRSLDQICVGWPARKPITRLQLHVGPLGSGAAVIDTKQPMLDVREHWRKLIGIEMEAYGVHLACQTAVTRPPQFLCMKSICDFAANKNDEWQDYAAFTAAKLCHLFLTEEWETLFPGA